MQKQYWLVLFFSALLVNLTGTLLQLDIMSNCAKPLLALSLMAWFASNVPNKTGSLNKLTLLALLFSLAGDTLLMFERMNPVYFMIGLVCFLIAHIFYIVVFNRLRTLKSIQVKWWVILIIVCYYIVLLTTLFPYLGEMKIPVIVYGAVISTMLFVALHLLFDKSIGNLMIAIGAVLFVSSDSILAFNKFYHSFNYAGLFIMFTYAFAQYFITKGIMQNISERN